MAKICRADDSIGMSSHIGMMINHPTIALRLCLNYQYPQIASHRALIPPDPRKWFPEIDCNLDPPPLSTLRLTNSLPTSRKLTHLWAGLRYLQHYTLLVSAGYPSSYDYCRVGIVLYIYASSICRLIIHSPRKHSHLEWKRPNSAWVYVCYRLSAIY